MGFEGRSRDQLEAEAEARYSKPVKPQIGGIAGPVICMAYVVLLLFIPLIEVECPGVKVSWTGMDLVNGSEGSIGGDLANQMGGELDMEGASPSEVPKDPMVLALPALALLVAFALVARSRFAANTLLVVLAGVLAYFSVVGFKLEREFASAMSSAMGSMPSDPTMGMMGSQMQMAETMLEDAISKTHWFWIAWAAVGLALVLVNVSTGRARSR